MAPPFVSVCITNYNYGRFLAAAIESALAQDHEPMEVIVVDDGSTDESKAVLERYDDRVRVVRKPNGGQASSMNAGFAAARGDVVLFLDADDVYEPGVVSRVAREFEREPRLAKVQYRMACVDASGEPVGWVLPGEAGVLPTGDLSRHVLRFRSYPSTPPSGSAWSAAALRRVLPMPEEPYRSNADAYLNELINLCGPIRSLDDVGVRYRVHGGNDYMGRALEPAWFHEKIGQVLLGHENVRRLCERLGIDGCPRYATQVRDPAFLTYRLASLKLDRRSHPMPADRWWRLGAAGLFAVLTHPLLSGRERVKRALWFLAVAPAPAPLARRIVCFYTPDAPGNRRLMRAVRRQKRGRWRNRSTPRQ